MAASFISTLAFDVRLLADNPTASHIFPIPCMLNVLVSSLPGLVTICVDAQREFVANGIVVERVSISLRYMNDRYVACSDIVYFALARALYFFFPHLREEAKSKPDWDDLEL